MRNNPLENNKYAKVFLLGMQSEMEYRANYWLQLFSFILPLLTQIFLWLAVFGSSGEHRLLGYTLEEMLIYAVMAAVTGRLIAAGFEYEIAADIKEGGLGKFLVQPVHYFAYRLFRFIGAKAVQSAVICMGAVFMLVGLSLWDSASVAVTDLFMYMLTLPGALLLNFLVYYTLSGMAFWITESSGLFYTLSLAIYVASGTVFPLTLFGETAGRVLSLLPFAYTVFFPVNAITGRLDVTLLAAGIGVQAFWIAVLLILSRLVWRTGVRRFVSVGG
ncbi:ABC-2 family transporter protein [Paenibacillus sp. P96]|uniref:ABC-2 family transporter protein n=1 Tax=Paenibacillus zeirhizosphaerae TaxID=2987519 RepID=A0ABT9FLY1_9BACL|nr:ABC-2 family transporter protein [Paenibacillus sp. P96]MDP4095715.1 ABC-2 family transporter protein [Paenibacillus sp. P96]